MPNRRRNFASSCSERFSVSSDVPWLECCTYYPRCYGARRGGGCSLEAAGGISSVMKPLRGRLAPTLGSRYPDCFAAPGGCAAQSQSRRVAVPPFSTPADRHPMRSSDRRPYNVRGGRTNAPARAPPSPPASVAEIGSDECCVSAPVLSGECRRVAGTCSDSTRGALRKTRSIAPFAMRHAHARPHARHRGLVLERWCRCKTGPMQAVQSS